VYENDRTRPGCLRSHDFFAPQALAQNDHHGPTPERKEQANALAKIVRDSTDRSRDASVALAEGYVPLFGCVSGSSEGAMGGYNPQTP